MNTFGEFLRLTTFGESHGPAMGGVIDGLPAGLHVDFDRVQAFVDSRRPGSSALVSARSESDRVRFLSGFSDDGVSLGTPVGFMVPNRDSRPDDYSELKDVCRPNHADWTYEAKYGLREWRGGGRASARETVSWVVAGGVAMHLLDRYGVSVNASLESVGENVTGDRIAEEIRKAASEGDSLGGIVRCSITGLPPGLGSPVFSKFHSRLAAAMTSINGVKGFEYGLGFESGRTRGSAVLDIPLSASPSGLVTSTNFSGGVQGGITNGMPVEFRVAFKPTPTIGRPVSSINSGGEKVTLQARGRHDPCIALRGVPVVEAMAMLVVSDALLEQRLTRIDPFPSAD